MYIHNLDPVLLDFGFIAIRWYSLAYIFGIVIGWWLGKKIIKNFLLNVDFKFDVKEFDDLITYLIISIIVGGKMEDENDRSTLTSSMCLSMTCGF